MGRKVFAIWLSLMMMFSALIIIDLALDYTPGVKGTTHYVGGAGPGNFSTIQDGINASNDGDTVFVYSGTYYENVVVNKTINLTGEDKDTVIINGSGNGDVVRIIVDWVNLTGFSLTESGLGVDDAGIELSSVGECRIYNNNASYNSYGFYLMNSDNNYIYRNDAFFNNNYGLLLYYADENEVYENNASLNKENGILLAYANKNNIDNNNASHNFYGIYLHRSIENNITNNTMVKDGIFITNPDNNLETNEIDTSNEVNGKPVVFIKNQEGGVVSPGAGQVILLNCTNVTVENQELTYGSIGILLGLSSNCSLKNNNASYNQYGIYLMESDDNNILSNNISLNSEYGLYIIDSNGNNITSNDINYNLWGICLSLSRDTRIVDNNVSFNSEYGILLMGSYYNNISSNNASYNYCGIYLFSSPVNTITGNIMIMDGIILRGSGINSWNTNDIDDTNTVNGKPVYFWKNKTAGTIPPGAGQIILANCINITIENQELTNGTVGIELGFSSYNNITRTNFSSNKWLGLFLEQSHQNNITDNTAFSNNLDGILLRDSDQNNIIGNNLSHNFNGINLTHYNWGSDSNTIIANNLFMNRNYGVRISMSDNNLVYHNNNFNNTLHIIFGGNNYWHNGYPLGGNYWSDYIGVDNYKGPNQDQPGSDGIGDTPYYLIGSRDDDYPLMVPYIDKPIENYLILRQGWNLISIPLIQQNQNLQKVLEMIDGYYDAVQWFDPTDNNKTWKHNLVGKPYGNVLFELNETMGFWIHITNPGDTIFLYNGTQPISNQTITLHPGWNLVGYPSLTSYNRTDALNNLTFGQEVDTIWTHNATTQRWEEIIESDYFEMGRGYWVHAKAGVEWEVPL